MAIIIPNLTEVTRAFRLGLVFQRNRRTFKAHELALKKPKFSSLTSRAAHIFCGRLSGRKKIIFTPIIALYYINISIFIIFLKNKNILNLARLLASVYNSKLT
jgi:hypothetical protein